MNKWIQINSWFVFGVSLTQDGSHSQLPSENTKKGFNALRSTTIKLKYVVVVAEHHFLFANRKQTRVLTVSS